MKQGQKFLTIGFSVLLLLIVLNYESFQESRLRENSVEVKEPENSNPLVEKAKEMVRKTQYSTTRDKTIREIVESPLFDKDQRKRGYESMITQLAKPLKCVKKSYWRGPHEKGLSVEERIEYSLNKRSEWPIESQKAVQICDDGAPMMKENELGFLFHVLQPGDLMLEWGGGKSSCVWAQVVGELHSVDDSSTWVSHFRRKGFVQNQIFHWMPSFEAAGAGRPPSSLDEYHLYMNLPFFIGPSCFKETNVKFDVILVDGRARPQCAYQALLLLKRDGLLAIHDWETSQAPLRPFYRIVLRWFELLHVEGVMAVFRIRTEKSGQEHHSEPGVFPSWWTKKLSTADWNMMDASKLSWAEPFEIPAPPTSEQRTRVLRNYDQLSKTPGFKKTKEFDWDMQ